MYNSNHMFISHCVAAIGISYHYCKISDPQHGPLLRGDCFQNRMVPSLGQREGFHLTDQLNIICDILHMATQTQSKAGTGSNQKLQGNNCFQQSLLMQHKH